jgi:urease accessory protein
MIDHNALHLNRLLQLCSANLPVGGFSFSQGLEYAVELGWVNNVDSTLTWVELNLSQSIARTDLAIIKRQFKALLEDDFTAFIKWNQHLIACRESNELHLADVAMGKALIRLLRQLESVDIEQYEALLNPRKMGNNISFVSAFVIAASLFDLDLLLTQSGYCWTYIDNQVAAATKLVPLGQTQSQNLLFEITEKVEESIQLANSLNDDEIGASLPRLAMASAWHETQYTRLFRS